MKLSQIWDELTGQGVHEATDYSGRQIKKMAYNQPSSKFGWIAEWILPLENGGSKNLDNIAIVHVISCLARENKLTYSINGVRWQIKKAKDGGHWYFKLGDKVKDRAMAFWSRELGDMTEAEDFAGYCINKGAYRDENSNYGWDIDHIQPLSKGGNDTDDNKQIVSIYVNREKADKTTFAINDERYQIHKTTKVHSDYYANGYDYSDKKYCIVEVE